MDAVDNVTELLQIFMLMAGKKDRFALLLQSFLVKDSLYRNVPFTLSWQAPDPLCQ